MKIKFKVYDRLESKWILPNVSSGERFKISANGDLLDPSGSPTDHLFEYFVSIGAKSVSGEDIFEGDIVKTKYSNGGGVYFCIEKVSWDEELSCWVLVNNRGEAGSFLPFHNYEIVGNIIENSDLLN